MSFATLALALLVAQKPATETHPAAVPVAPTEESFAAWARHLEADPAESRWRQIPWHASFAEGLASASESRKPLLFWAMNGHPLGCT